MIRNADAPDSRPLDEILHDSPVLKVGKFRVGPNDPRFHDSGPAQNHIFVFPRTLVRIRHEGTEPFVAGPDVVTYYNRGQVYRRESVEGRPDRCEWFAFAPVVLEEAIAVHDPAVADRPDRPFRDSHGPGDPAAYLEQRRVVEALSGPEGADPLDVEETMLRVLARVLAARQRAERTRAGAAAAARDRGLAEAARIELGKAPGDRRSLSEVADALDTSVFHLCRAFRRHTGTTLHAYRNRLRLARALELVRRRGRDLTRVALALGYSSHSHFTAAFRREYGVTPSRALGARAGVR